jgi:hypothetical protein
MVGKMILKWKAPRVTVSKQALLWWSDVQNFLSETLAFLKQRRELNEQALDINYGVHKATLTWCLSK